MLLRDLRPYEKLEGNYVVKFKKPVQEYQKGFMFQLRIGDSSMETMMTYWGQNNRKEVEKVYDSIKTDDVIRITGETAIYNDRLIININPPEEGITVLQPGDYDPSEFVPKTDKDVNSMYIELKGILSDINDEKLKELVESFMDDSEFEKEFKKAPAAMYLHHGWLGGLLEHTLNVVKICDNICDIHPELDRDLALVGALFHDVGKIEEFEVKSSIKTSPKGMLVGHMHIGIEKLTKRMEDLKVPEELQMKVKHIMLSHHGRKEYGTPKEPAIPEALAVYYADDLDSKVTEMITRIKTAQTDDDYMYIRSMGRNVYLK